MRIQGGNTDLHADNLVIESYTDGIETNQATELTRLGDVTETAPGTDTGSSGINGRLQRIAQRLTSLLANAIPAGTNLIGKVSIDQTTPGTTNNVEMSLVEAPVAPATATATKSILVGAQYNSTQPTLTNGQQSALSVTARDELIIGGVVAGGATAIGNPIPQGAENNSTLPTYSNGQRAALQSDTRGGQYVVLKSNNAAGAVSVAVPGNGQSPQTTLYVTNQGERFNGATWDQEYANVDTAALVTLAAAAPATTNSADQINYNARGVKVVVDITAIATQTVVVKIQGKDVASGKYYDILTSASLATVATTVLEVYPGCIAVANTVVNVSLPRTWRVNVVGAVGGTVTLTVGASIIN